MSQAHEAQSGSLEQSASLEGVAVFSPGVLGSFDVVAALQLPAGLDLHAQWEAYNACGGRLMVVSGQGTLDHRTVGFDRWLVGKFSKEGARSLATHSLGLQKNGAPEERLPVIEHEGRSLPYFIPITEELNPNIH